MKIKNTNQEKKTTWKP